MRPSPPPTSRQPSFNSFSSLFSTLAVVNLFCLRRTLSPPLGREGRAERPAMQIILRTTPFFSTEPPREKISRKKIFWEASAWKNLTWEIFLGSLRMKYCAAYICLWGVLNWKCSANSWHKQTTAWALNENPPANRRLAGGLCCLWCSR